MGSRLSTRRLSTRASTTPCTSAASRRSRSRTTTTSSCSSPRWTLSRSGWRPGASSVACQGNTAQPTWLDIRLFHTLVRFDPVYVVYFKTNAKVRRSVNVRHIKMHYFTSHVALNTYGIIPGHDGPDLLADPGREHLATAGLPGKKVK